MTYPNLKFPELPDRPYYYSNFVQTLDGKVDVSDGADYWPIGSPTDYSTLVDLRAYADVLIHGKNTFLAHPTLSSLAKPDFAELRTRLGKSEPLAYVIVSAHPDTVLAEKLSSTPLTTQVILATTDESLLPELPEGVTVWRCGTASVNLHLLSVKLKAAGYAHGLVEGGPHLMGEFVAADLLDEVFMTIAPKIFGSAKDRTITMVEGHLISPESVPAFQLRETHQIQDELFLRYVRAV